MMFDSDLEIITLVENLAYRQGTKGEHGLSFLLRIAGKQILFDTGQSDLLLANARKLDINLAEVDAAVISHGHYDHAGGLRAFLGVNRHAPVYIKPAAFDTKFSRSGGQVRPTGMSPHLLEAFSERVLFVDEKIELIPGLYIIPTIESHYPFEQSSSNLLVEREGQLMPDDFSDELFLAFDHPEGLTILSGCSHLGILNICQTALDLTGSSKIRALLGGTHLKGASTGRVEQTLEAFDTLQVEQFGLCHCTGLGPYMEFVQKYGDIVRYAYVGTMFRPYGSEA